VSAETSHGSGAFTALRYPNYRLWFAGQLVSLVGTWMQNTAQAFLVFELTRSSAFLGYVAFAAGMPAWLLMLYGGVVADRVPRRTLLLVTQGSMMLLAFGLASLTLFGQVRATHVVVFAFLLGVANAFDAPARQSFVFEMVSKQDLANAIALNSSLFNAGAAVGPAVAGLTYAAFGPGWCFLLNGCSFVPVLTALGLMRLAPRRTPLASGSPLRDLKVGVHYVTTQPSIRTLIALVGATTVFGISYTTLLPAWAVRILGGDATTNGLLQSARGLGALGGALGIAALGRFRRKGRVLMVGSLLFPMVLAVFSLTRSLGSSLATLVVAGTASILVLNLANALVQTLVRDELRGRVMGIYSLVFLGSMPVGGVLMGALGERIGEPGTVALGAACLFTVALLARWLTPALKGLE
jgi:MFS family permease